MFLTPKPGEGGGPPFDGPFRRSDFYGRNVIIFQLTLFSFVFHSTSQHPIVAEECSEGVGKETIAATRQGWRWFKEADYKHRREIEFLFFPAEFFESLGFKYAAWSNRDPFC